MPSAESGILVLILYLAGSVLPGPCACHDGLGQSAANMEPHLQSLPVSLFLLPVTGVAAVPVTKASSRRQERLIRTVSLRLVLRLQTSTRRQLYGLLGGLAQEKELNVT